MSLLVAKADISTMFDTSGKVADAKAVGDALDALSAAVLLYASGSTSTIKDVVDDALDDIDTLQGLTGDDIKYDSGTTSTISDIVDAIDGRVVSIEAWTASSIPYVAGGATMKATIDDILSSEAFAVHFDSNPNIARATFIDNRITSDHVVVNTTVNHTADVSWATATSTLTVECESGIPAMNLLLAIPATES